MLSQFKKFAEECKDDGFLSYEWSERIIVRGNQTFAIFGDTAYDVSKQKFNYDKTCIAGSGKLCVPIKGKYLAEFPDEGRSGIMGLCIVTRKGKNIRTEPMFVPCGWLHTEELKLTNEEILDNIIDDVERGENVFTDKPAGWL